MNLTIKHVIEIKFLPIFPLLWPEKSNFINTLNSTVFSKCTQGAAASASLEILLEMEIIGPHLKPTESETGVTPAICFKSRLGGFDVR